MTSDNPQTPPRRRRYALLMVLSVLLLLVAGGVALIGLAPQWLMHVAPSPSQESQAPMMQSLERRLSAVEKRIQVLGDELAAAAAKNSGVIPVASHQLWWLAESERYLVAAHERLDAGGSAESALTALKFAKQTLANIDLASADTVKSLLDEEIRLLSEYRNEDATRAIATIDALLTTLDHATSLQPQDARPEPQAERDTEPADGDVWTRLSDTVNTRLKQLVVTHKQNEAPTIHDAYALVVQSLLFARSAVLSNDHLSYRHALTHAMQILKRHGETSGEIDTTLQALLQLDITAAPPYRGESLRELRALASRLNRQITP